MSRHYQSLKSAMDSFRGTQGERLKQLSLQVGLLLAHHNATLSNLVLLFVDPAFDISTVLGAVHVTVPATQVYDLVPRILQLVANISK